MLTLLLQSARLRMLMAWCSTLGGAHSSLGEVFFMHVCKSAYVFLVLKRRAGLVTRWSLLSDAACNVTRQQVICKLTLSVVDWISDFSQLNWSRKGTRWLDQNGDEILLDSAWLYIPWFHLTLLQAGNYHCFIKILFCDKWPCELKD